MYLVGKLAKKDEAAKISLSSALVLFECGAPFSERRFPGAQ
jgi:hypothetical protein